MSWHDDMSHMEAVFLPIDRDKPALPYDEFIVEGGLHPIGSLTTRNRRSLLRPIRIPEWN
jgi:hypothetical protein